MELRCYAQRLLNPFRGAMHVVKRGDAEAVTVDGLHWDIYVAMEDMLDALWGVQRVQVADIRFGSWSAAKGLKRGPRYPSEDFRRMEAQGQALYEHLIRVHGQVPFAFADRFELWLLDGSRRPLALLHSAVEEAEMPHDAQTEWRAGMAARERFASPAMDAIGGGARNAAVHLAGYVNAAAGPEPSAQWFLREADGSGRGLQVLGPADGLAGRTLAADAFAPLLLANCGHDEAHRRLIDDFLAWQAPWLLCLPVAPALRRGIERQARAQAQAIADLHRLYPEVIDAEGIRAARVEAVMRRSQAARADRGEEHVPPFYIELDPGPADPP
jgi:hypothetical protein